MPWLGPAKSGPALLRPATTAVAENGAASSRSDAREWSCVTTHGTASAAGRGSRQCAARLATEPPAQRRTRPNEQPSAYPDVTGHTLTVAADGDRAASPMPARNPRRG